MAHLNIISEEDLVNKFDDLLHERTDEIRISVIEPQSCNHWNRCLAFWIVTDSIIPFPGATKNLLRVWDLSKNTNVAPLSEPGTFLIHLPNSTIKERILNGGPWTFNGNFVATKQIDPEIPIRELEFNYIDLYIQLHGLKPMHVDPSIVISIASKIGEVIQPSDLDLTNWAAFARVKVRFDLRKPLVDKIVIDLQSSPNYQIFIYYERLHKICYFCGILGHASTNCALKTGLFRKIDERYSCAEERDDMKMRVKPRIGKWVNSTSHFPWSSKSPTSIPSPSSPIKYLSAPTASFQLSPSTALKLQKGDITVWSIDGSSDAIVNAANESMLGGGGVDGAIHRAAGPELLQACKQVPQIRPGVRCPTGEARITPAFHLPVAHVIHTTGPIYDIDMHPVISLRNCYKNSMKVAKENDIKHISFPAISCGVHRYPFNEASRIAVSTVKEFSQGFEEVHFVLFSDELYETWVEAARELLQ